MESISKSDFFKFIRQGLNDLAADSLRVDRITNQAKVEARKSNDEALKSEVDTFVKTIKDNQKAQIDTNKSGVGYFIDQLASIDGDGDNIDLSETSTEGLIARTFIDPSKLEATNKADIFQKQAIKSGIVLVREGSYQNTSFRKIASQQAFLRSKGVQVPIDGLNSEKLQQAIEKYNKEHPDDQVPEYFAPAEDKNEASGYIFGPGNYGDRVRLLQTTLNKVIKDLQISGVDELVIDGNFGTKTEAAVKAIQSKINEGRAEKIPVDGIWGPLTESALIALEENAITGLGRLKIE